MDIVTIEQIQRESDLILRGLTIDALDVTRAGSGEHDPTMFMRISYGI